MFGARRPKGGIRVVNYATPQLAATAAAGKRLIFPSNQTYTVADLAISANTYVEGNNSTLKFANNTTINTSTSDALLHVNGSGVTIDNLNFDGNSANQSGIWSQHRHCLRVHGAYSNVVVKNCDMVNCIGDGVYVNTQTSGPITIGPNNTISANYDARNGISVVSGDTVEVWGNTVSTFARHSPPMPGAIDIEPNNDADHLQHIDVHDNIIIGGTTAGTGTIAGVIYTAVFASAVGVDIKIRNNDVSGTRLTSGIVVIGKNGGPFNTSGITVSGNNVHDIGAADRFGMELNYWIGAAVTGNTFNGMDYGIYNYHACLGATTGNTFTGVFTNITNDGPQCS